LEKSKSNKKGPFHPLSCSPVDPPPNLAMALPQQAIIPTGKHRSHGKD
jgi:hypothetical protein